LEDQRFIDSINKTSYRESVVGSALARNWRMCINFTPYHPTDTHKDEFDYLLFDPLGGRSSIKVEQQESHQIKDEEKDSFCIELATYTSTHKKLGKFHYCSADILLINCTNINKIYLFQFDKFKQYCVYLHEQDLLTIYDSKDKEKAWRETHDTCPVKLAYLEIQKTLYDLNEDVEAFTYKQLGIFNPLTLNFN